MSAADDTILAEQLRPLLKPARGFPPKLSHIRAALLMVRDDKLSSREACRRASRPDDPVPQGARDRIAELKSRITPLIDALQHQPAPPQPLPPQPPQPPPQQPVAQPSMAQVAVSDPDLPAAWDLPPLEATREPPNELPPTPLSPPPPPLSRHSPPLSHHSGFPPSPASTDYSGSASSFPMPDVVLAAPPQPPLSQPWAVTTSSERPRAPISGVLMKRARHESDQRRERGESDASVAGHPLANEARRGGSLRGPRATASPPTLTPPPPPPSRPTVLPDDARDDLDMDTYLHRESLRDPSLRCLLPKSLRKQRRRPQPYGMGLEPEDLGLLDEPTIFTSATGASSPCEFPPTSPY